MQILFWDIDGTLIRSGGAGKAAMEYALTAEFGIPFLHDTVPYAGRTDYIISHDLLQVHGIDPTWENIERLNRSYLSRLPQELQLRGGTVMPGVVPTIEQAKNSARLTNALLTGNVKEGAKIKLSYFQLWDHFAFGGFADGCLTRPEVAQNALRVAQSFFQETIDPQSCWVIGDTPDDVRCARAIGAKAVAVGTGWHSKEQLLAADPDAFVPDFTQAWDLLKRWKLL